MKPLQFLLLATIVFISPTISHAQVAGSTLLGVSVAEPGVFDKRFDAKVAMPETGLLSATHRSRCNSETMKLLLSL